MRSAAIRHENGDDAPVERGEADAERLGGLRARVGESFDPLGELELADKTCGRRRGGVTVLRGGLTALPARRKFEFNRDTSGIEATTQPSSPGSS